MKDLTEIRMQEIRHRTRRYRNRCERRVIACLTLCSLFLLAGMGILRECIQRQGTSSLLAAEGYGAVLLRNGAERYVTVGIAAFVAGVMLTILCIRCRKKRANRISDAEEREE